MRGLRGLGGLLSAIARGLSALGERSEESHLGRELRALGGTAMTSAGPPYIVRRDITVIGEAVHLGGVWHYQLHAQVRVPSSLRFLTLRGWDGRPHPALPLELPVDGFLRVALGRACAAERPLALWCDGEQAVAQAAPSIDRRQLDAVIDALVAVARHDGGLTETLHGLPDAVELTGHELDPGVSFAEDGLLLGVRERARMVAQLDNFPVTGTAQDAPTAALLEAAGDGDLLVTSTAARFTWRGIERDPDRLLAGVRALRSLRAKDGAYR